ncbi:MAG: RDD family protein [Acidimicrobiales bacterium]
MVAAWALLGSLDRPWADLFLAFMVVWGVEAGATIVIGATPGKLALGLRLSELDRAGRPEPAAVARRGAMVAVLTTIPVIGWGIWILSTFVDPLGRGLPDRSGRTMVVPKGFGGAIATRDLPGYADAARPPRMSPLGRVGDLDVRYRARLRRIEGFPVLAGAIGLLALAASLRHPTAQLILISSVVWIVIFVIHETRLVSSTGVTPGHTLAGLVILDRATGRPPTTGRSFVRALVLGLTMYVPLLWPLLGISLITMAFGSYARGLHDYAARTVVVSDPRLAPEAQRQRTMRMRLGLAG